MEKTFKIDHLGFVVQDIEKTVKMYNDYLGIKEWKMLKLEPPKLYETKLYGSEVTHSFKIATAQFGDTKIELLMPVKGNSVYSEFLKEGNEGFHHLCLLFKSQKELKRTGEELIKKGGKIIQSGKVKNKSFYQYIEKERIILELLFRE